MLRPLASLRLSAPRLLAAPLRLSSGALLPRASSFPLRSRFEQPAPLPLSRWARFSSTAAKEEVVTAAKEQSQEQGDQHPSQEEHASNPKSGKEEEEGEKQQQQKQEQEQKQEQQQSFFRSDTWIRLVGYLGALANWGIPLAAIMHIFGTADPKTTIDPMITLSLLVYSALFFRWALAISPANYPLSFCHVCNFIAQTVQLGRWFNANYLN